MIDPFYADLLAEEAREVAYAERVFGARPTGSRWFGVNDPENPDVDFDLYCIQQAPTWQHVIERAGWEPPVQHVPGQPCEHCMGDGCSSCDPSQRDDGGIEVEPFHTFRMGRLNLIMLSPDAWWRWRLATDLCRFNRGPKSKERRVQLSRRWSTTPAGSKSARCCARQPARSCDSNRVKEQCSMREELIAKGGS